MIRLQFRPTFRLAGNRVLLFFERLFFAKSSTISPFLLTSLTLGDPPTHGLHLDAEFLGGEVVGVTPGKGKILAKVAVIDEILSKLVYGK